MNSFSIIGFIAAILTTIAFLPQVIKSYRTKGVKNISLLGISLQATGNGLWLLYGLLIRDFPLITANTITFSLVCTLIILKLRYK